MLTDVDNVRSRRIVDCSELKAEVYRLLELRHVTVSDIAEVVLEIQKPYFPDITVEECSVSVRAVIDKREVQHAIVTGVALDILAEENLLPEPLCSILINDDPLYGVDEVVALSITNIYGTIGLTNFGYLDKQKIGIIGRLDKRNDEPTRVNTFLDDLIAAVAAAAASRIAHQRRG